MVLNSNRVSNFQRGGGGLLGGSFELLTVPGVLGPHSFIARSPSFSPDRHHLGVCHDECFSGQGGHAVSQFSSHD